MPPPTSVKLYILGKVDHTIDTQNITVFAEFRDARGLSHVHLDKSKMDTLIQQIVNLRGFAEGGAPPLTRRGLRQLGGKLQEILLVGKTRELFTHATAVAKAEGVRRLPLEIIAEDYEIAGWPWEYLHDDERGFISQDFHPISRSIFSIQSAQPCPPIDGKIKILIILGVAPDDPRISPGEEIAIINEVFSTQLDAEKFEIRVFDAIQRSKLVLELTNQEYDIVHFFGHAGFDAEEEEGYLAFSRTEGNPFRVSADQFAAILSERGIRLVFLNACKTAQGATTESPGRSSVAGALLAQGIPAVVGAQFSLPERSAHFLAATIYNALLTGKPIGEAMRDGRNVMGIADQAQFFDWGIPVLYAKDSAATIFPLVGKKPSWAARFEQAVNSYNFIAKGSAELKGPSVVVERTREVHNAAQVEVALIDIDANVGFLPDLAEKANAAQDFYNFAVAYIPVPAGYVRTDLGKASAKSSLTNRPQTYIPRLEKYLNSIPNKLSVDFACCITSHPVAGREGKRTFSEHFSAELNSNENVMIISTADMREYAAAANTSFEKAVFRLCLSEIVSGDQRWKGLETHDDTVGCLFDFCYDRDDIVLSLRNPVFDHGECRDKIKDPKQLAAIDALMKLTAPGQADIFAAPKSSPHTGVGNTTTKSMISVDERRVLETMYGGQYRRRTASGIARDMNMRRESVESLLANLLQQGFVGEVRSKDERRYLYRLLPRGSAALESSSSPEGS